MADKDNAAAGDKGWAEKPGFIRAFQIGLAIACVLAALAGFVPGWHNPHPHFAAEKFPIFFAVMGFASFMGIVLVGQHLRKLVGRREGYYRESE
ncbi:MAG: hypothetical protein AAFW83_00720 [Pseudomonadota bacterium]